MQEVLRKLEVGDKVTIRGVKNEALKNKIGVISKIVKDNPWPIFVELETGAQLWFKSKELWPVQL